MVKTSLQIQNICQRLLHEDNLPLDVSQVLHDNADHLMVHHDAPAIKIFIFTSNESLFLYKELGK
jgi:hypothetical protein